MVHGWRAEGHGEKRTLKRNILLEHQFGQHGLKVDLTKQHQVMGYLIVEFELDMHW